MNRRSLTSLLFLALGGVVFAGMLYVLGFDEIISVISRARPSYVVLSVVPFLASNGIRFYKWDSMSRRMGVGHPRRELLGMYAASKFWGMAMPMRAGELVPALVSTEGRGGILSIIVFDRVLESYQTLSIFALVLVWLSGRLFGAEVWFTLAGLAALITLSVFVLFSRRCGRVFVSFVEWLHERFMGGRDSQRVLKLRLMLDEYYRALSSFFSYGYTSWLFVVTYVAWFFEVAMWVVLLWSISSGVPVTLAAGAMAVFHLAGALSPVPGGLGTSEVSAAFLFSHFGYAIEAGSMMVLFRLLNTVYLYAAYNILTPKAARKSLSS